MSEFEQLETLKKNISQVQDPAILFAMNQTARRLQEDIDRRQDQPKVNPDFLRDKKVKVFNN